MSSRKLKEVFSKVYRKSNVSLKVYGKVGFFFQNVNGTLGSTDGHKKNIKQQKNHTSIALINILVSLKGIFSGNFSLTMATSKQSPKSMCIILPLIRSNIRFEGCLEITESEELMKCVFDIGIKHGFLCINICWAPRDMLKPEPERRGFQPLLRSPADFNVSENHV